MAEGQKKIVWWQVLLVAGTLIAAVLKILISMDCDESYIVAMGARLLQKDRLFDDMWELHMTSAWPAFLGMYLYQKVTGGLEGVVLYLRILATAVQFGVVIFTCRILRKYYKQDAVFLSGIAAACFLPRATQNLEYGLLVMLFLLPAAALLYDVLKNQEKSGKIVWWKLILAGILYALGVLSYPTVVFSFPVLLAALYLLPCHGTEQKRWKLPTAFLGICVLCAAAFLAYVLSYLPVGQLLENLSGILMDGTHSDVGRIESYLPQLISMIKRTIPVAALAFCGGLVLKKWKTPGITFLYLMSAVFALVVMGCNLTGIRESGPIGLQVRYIAAAVLGFVCCKKVRDRFMLGLFLLPGVFVYIGVLAGSNMGLEENASFLFLTVFSAVLLGASAVEQMDVSVRKVCFCCLGIFVSAIVFTKGYLVRVTGTGPANIMEERVQVKEGPLAGIFLYREDALAYLEKRSEILEFTKESDTMLYLGNDALCNLYTKGRFTSASCISTPAYNEQWVQYYENEEHWQPTVIFLDKAYFPSFKEFLDTEFGTYLMERDPQEEAVEEEAFFILRMPNNKEMVK